MNLFRNWYYLSANMTAPEESLEVEIARLGERYRSQWLFPRIYHIADFVLLDRKIVVEVDGASHLTPVQIRKDLVHSIELERMGYAVVRVSNKDALENPRGVVDMLYYLCSTRPSLPELQEALAALPLPPARTVRRGKPTKPAMPGQAPPST